MNLFEELVMRVVNDNDEYIVKKNGEKKAVIISYEKYRKLQDEMESK